MSSAIPPVLMVSVNHLKAKVRYGIQFSVQFRKWDKMAPLTPK